MVILRGKNEKLMILGKNAENRANWHITVVGYL
jgi:hypothetical protein